MPYLAQPRRAKHSSSSQAGSGATDNFKSITGTITNVTSSGWSYVRLANAPLEGRIIRVRAVKTSGNSAYVDVAISENNNQDLVGTVLKYSNAPVGGYGLDSGEEIYYSSPGLYLLTRVEAGSADIEYRVDIQTQGEVQVSQAVAGSRVVPPNPLASSSSEGGVPKLHDLTDQVGAVGNMDYTLAPPAVIESFSLVRNGLTLLQGPNADYILLSPTQVRLNDPPYAGANLQAWYVEST